MSQSVNEQTENGRFTSETARRAGRLSGRARQKLTPERVADHLGELKTSQDAERWLRRLTVLAVSGKMAGTVLNASVRAVEIWLRIKEAEASFEVIEALRADVRALRDERDRAVRELELARLGVQ